MIRTRTLTALLCIAAIAFTALPGAAVYLLPPPVTLCSIFAFGAQPAPARVAPSITLLPTLLAMAVSGHTARAALPSAGQ